MDVDFRQWLDDMKSTPNDSSRRARMPSAHRGAKDSVPNAHVLIVEDTNPNQLVTLATLDGLGFTAKAVTNRHEAI